MIADVECAINSDFRDCIFTIEQLQDESFLPEEKAEILIFNMYLSVIKDNIEDEYEETDIELKKQYEEKINQLILHIYENRDEAIKKALCFLQRGKEIDMSENVEANIKFPLFDISKDSNDIYDAFDKSGIDLDDVDIHWWRFISRFTELPESKFTRKIYLRSQIRDGKLSPEEQNECERIGWDAINILKESEEVNHEAITDFYNQGR